MAIQAYHSSQSMLEENESPNVCENEYNTEEFHEEYTEDSCEQPITIDDINIVTEMNTSQLAIQGRYVYTLC